MGRVRVRPRRTIAAALAATFALAGCAGPVPTPQRGAERCRDLGEEIVQLAWSQTGAFLAVGTVDAQKQPWARVIRADDPDLALDQPRSVAGMLAGTVVVRADGNLAWIAESPAGRVLVQDTPDGEATRLPDDVTEIAWTAIGYALLQRPPEGGSKVLLLDVDRPDRPSVLYETDLAVQRLWTSADPEFLLLTIAHPDHLDMRPSFDVVLPDGTRHIEPPGSDLTGGSMPVGRGQVVYRSAADGRMHVVSVSQPNSATVLSERPATLGRVSDGGLLAIAAADQVGRLCVVEVAALVR